MSYKPILVLLGALIVLPAYGARDLPEACGAADTKFDVRIDKNSAPVSTAAPGEGQARIFFLESVKSTATMIGRPTVRIGVDGAWVGALHGKSYFTTLLPAGEHHICASWQSHLREARKQNHAKSLLVEAGKSYFLEYKVNLISADAGQMTLTSLELLDPDEGKLRLQDAALATWTSR